MDPVADGTQSHSKPRPHELAQSSSLPHLMVIGDEAQEQGGFVPTGTPHNAESEDTSDAQVVASEPTLINYQFSNTEELESNPTRSRSSLPEEHDDLLQLFDWVARLLVLCVGAIGAVVQAMDTTVPLPITFNIACFLVIIGFSALFISKNLPRKTPARTYVRALLHAGQFLAATALFLAITILFPLYLKLVSWAIYSISILVVALLHFYRFTAKPPL